MNSKTLTEKGFVEWLPLKSLAHSHLPADQGIVIAMVDTELSGKPESDILYIGRTKKPSKRILGGYLGGYGGKNTKKINQMLFDNGYIEKVSISWVSTEKPRIMQEQLLATYKEEHGEVPVWNAKKKPNLKLKTSAFRRKEAPAPKTKLVAAKNAAKPGPKPKAVSKKSAMGVEAPPKAEVSKKEEAGAETAPKPQAPNGEKSS